jgi:transposase
VQTAKQHDAQTLYRLQSVPGIGKILSLVLLYEIHDISRFPRVQDCVSSCRLVTWAKESAGKRDGTSGTKIGHASLTWAFSEAAGLFLRNNPAGQKSLARLENKHGTGKALTVLAHQLARAISDMLKRDVVFNLDTFLQSSGRGVGEPAAELGHDGRAWQPCSAMMHRLRRRTLMST